MTLRGVGRSAFLATAALIVAAAVARVADHFEGSRDWTSAPPSREMIVRGEYLARLGDCAACHSVAGKPPYSGGLGMSTPIGTVFSTNITPDPIHGIGAFTLVDFDRAVRFGVSRGHTLYPAMPYTSYRVLLPDDVAALYAYFQNAVSPAAIPNNRNAIPFPLSMRWPLTYWRWLFAAPPAPYAPPMPATSQVARGGYLVEGLGHCGECHTSRNLALALRALTPDDGNAFLSGARIEGYFAPSLRSEGPGTLADWSKEDIARFLMTGANRDGIAFASMSEVVTRSTQYLTPEDALAMAAFLKTVTTPGKAFPPAFTPSDVEHSKLQTGDVSTPGAQLYLDNCAACHRPDGKGYEGVFPALAGNPVVVSEPPDSVIAIVLKGGTTPGTRSTPALFTMPSLHWRLGDEGVAQVATFVRSSWGNQASPIEVADVRAVRERLE